MISPIIAEMQAYIKANGIMGIDCIVFSSIRNTELRLSLVSWFKIFLGITFGLQIAILGGPCKSSVSLFFPRDATFTLKMVLPDKQICNHYSKLTTPISQSDPIFFV
jgi:hypothetical protein